MCIYGCVYFVSAVGILYKQPSGTDHGNFLQSYQKKLVWNFMQMVDCMRTACCMQAEGLGGFRCALWPLSRCGCQLEPHSRKLVRASEFVNAQVGSGAHCTYSAFFYLHISVHMFVDVFVHII